MSKVAGAAALVAVALAAGPTWTPQPSGVSARLRGVSAVSETVAWASGADGTVLRTLDGGRRWTPLTVPDARQLDFRDVDAFDGSTAYVLSIGNGDASRIYKTTDGGVNWTLQLANKDPNVFLDAMAFWSADAGIAFSDSAEKAFVIFRTNDGQTWKRIPAAGLPPALEGEGAYAASGTNVAVHGTKLVWIGTTASRVLRSSDGGSTWSVSQTRIPTGPSSGIFSIAFRSETHGVVVGGDYKQPSDAIDNVAFTSDGGRAWTLGRGLSGYRSAVAHVPGTPSSWLAVGPDGSDISHDDGRTWSRMEGAGFHAFAFARGRRLGWAAGEGGTISRLEGL